MAILERNPWFAECRPETRGLLMERGEPRLLKRGATLCQQGDAARHLTMVVEGCLAGCSTTRTGKRLVLAYLGPGQLVNLIPILDEQPVIHDITAHADTLVFQVPREHFLEALEADAGLVRAVLRLHCLRFRQAYSLIAHTTLLPLDKRCAHALMQLAVPFGLPRTTGLEISLKLSQDEFADLVGCSRPAANRELKKLEAQGAIRMTYSHFVVLDMATLRLLAEG